MMRCSKSRGKMYCWFAHQLDLFILIVAISNSTNFVSCIPYEIHQYHPPLISKGPGASTINLKIIEPFLLECEATGELTVEYEWKKNGVFLANRTYNTQAHIFLQSGTGTLVIEAFGKEDEGWYQCFAKNYLSTATSNAVFLRDVGFLSLKYEAEPVIVTAIEFDTRFNLTCGDATYNWTEAGIFWGLQDNAFGVIKPVPSSRAAVDGKGNLQFSYVSKDDENDVGYHYACYIMLQLGGRDEITVVYKTILKVNASGLSEKEVMEPPFRKYLSAPEMTAHENRESRLYCIYGGIPSPRIDWYRNGDLFNTSSRREFILDDSNSSLSIKNVSNEHAGNYTCTAVNNYGRDEYTVKLKVFVAPQFSSFMENQIKLVDDTVELSCFARSQPEADIFWIYNGNPIVEERKNPRLFIVSKNAIKIERIQKADSGNYGCNASNVVGYVYQEVYVQVFERTRFKSGFVPVNSLVRAGHTIEFSCATLKDRALTSKTRWKRNDALFDEKVDPRVSWDETTSTLTLRNTTISDTGLYTCIVSTELDQISTNATLLVQDRPASPRITNVTNCRNKEPVISWKTMSEHGAPILEYVIQYNTSFVPDSWFEIKRINVSDAYDCNELSVVIEPWANYTFRMLARNRFGWSDASPHYPEICQAAEDVPFENPSNVTANGEGPNELIVSWTPMPQVKHHAPGFHYQVWWKRKITNAKWTNSKVVDWSQSRYVVNKIPAYQEYIVKVIAHNSLGQANAAVQEVSGFSGEDVPMESPSNVWLIGNATATSANITWTAVNAESVRGPLLGYKIRIRSVGESGIQEIDVGKKRRATIDKLIPNTVNFVRVIVYNNKYESVPSNKELIIETPEGVPDQVHSVRIQVLGSSAFLLSWLPPFKPNGRLIGYNLCYQTVDNSTLGPMQERSSKLDDPTNRRVKLSGLKADTTYRIYLSASTMAGKGKTYSIEEKTGVISLEPIIRPDFHLYNVAETNSINATVRVQWLPCGEKYGCDEHTGSYFIVTYKKKNEPNFSETIELVNDYSIIRDLLPNKIYVFRVTSADGNLQTQSVEKEFVVFNPINLCIEKNDPSKYSSLLVAILAILFFIFVSISSWIIKRKNFGKYTSVITHDQFDSILEARNSYREFRFKEYFTITEDKVDSQKDSYRPKQMSRHEDDNNLDRYSIR